MPGMSGVDLVRLHEVKSPLNCCCYGCSDSADGRQFDDVWGDYPTRKRYDSQQLLEAVDRGLTISGQQCEQTQREQDIQRRLNQLTDEERNVMDRLLADKPNKAISAELHLSLRTVDRRRQSVLEKLGVSSVPEMALMIGPLRNAEIVGRQRVAQS